MATKKGSKFVDALRKAFMTRDSEAFEKVANEMTGDEGGEGGDGQPQIHIHMPGTGTDPKAGASGGRIRRGIPARVGPIPYSSASSWT